MTTTIPSAVPATRSRRIWFRVGLVLAGVMSVFNSINGAGSLIDPTFAQTDPTMAPQPMWMSGMLLAFGLATLAAVVPAWRGVRSAILVVVASRLLEAWSAVALPFLPDAPDGILAFALVLVAVGTAVSLMVAQGLRTTA